MVTGFKDHRLKHDDSYHFKEIAFVEIFNKDYLKEIHGLVFGYKNGISYPIDYLTEREEKIVLGIIQWLGTPVGQGFIENVNKKYEQLLDIQK